MEQTFLDKLSAASVERQLTQEPNEQREQSGACSNFAESRERKSEAQWDKVFPQSDKVEHSKITFHNRYGITLVADINTEDFLAAVDFLSVQENVDPERIGIIGICA